MNHDIIIIGGGISGAVAAIAAARRGADVLIIEKNACLGGKVAVYRRARYSVPCNGEARGDHLSDFARDICRLKLIP